MPLTMLAQDVLSWSLIQYAFAAVVLSYSPFAVYQIYLMVISLFGNDAGEAKRFPVLDRANNVIVVITTNGMATDVVEKIISTIRGYGLDLEIFVVKEHRDGFSYSSREITVPKEYVCPNGSRNKMRAMQYGNEWLRREGYGRETYICHLDDDSMVDRPYLEFVINHMTAEGGQGCIRLREFGRHLFSSLSDIVRVANCEAWCRHYNRRNRPQFVHGEGIVVRADVEQEIGWDYGTYGAEDLIMGLEISKRYGFCHIPAGNIYIAPPTTARDYYKQRRRWFWSIFKNDGKVRRLSLRTYLFYIYMYLVGVTGLAGLVMLSVYILSDIYISPTILLLCILNIVAFMGYYQFGALYNGSRKYALILFILQIPVAFYDGFTIFYSLLTRPDFQTFETIKKV
ncbi:MAG: glycosyltransferase family 2 protein [Candidatus Methanomethylophilaceae archaeon]|nr:glycosyltransferase family 2 protein [Candidatus Methanomethylophilaceae archaeon]NLF33531.1 glycosyltransferase [Thermoplasmatales archaeon]